MKALIAGGGTGGHLTPALAIGEGLRRSPAQADVVLVGARRGIEAGLLPGMTFRYHLLPAEPLYRRQWWRNLKWPWLAWRLLREVDRVLAVETPDLVLGTGGYAAGPVVWRAARRGIPTAIHESNAYPGLATRALARVVRHVYLGFPEATSRLRPGGGVRVLVTGNPIRPAGSRSREAARHSLGLEGNRPTLLVFGGSQGAAALNRALAQALEGGNLAEVALVWCTGQAHYEGYRHFAQPGRVVVAGFLNPLDDGYAAADLAVSRSGAMTTAELAAWGVPAIYVPLPTAARGHQLHNAQAVEAEGGAVVLKESQLEAASLVQVVRALIGSPERLAAMRAAQRQRARPEATATVVSSLLTLLG